MKPKSKVNEAGNYTKPSMQKALFEKIKAAWATLSDAEKKATNSAKSAGNKAGKQFVAQPESVAAKTAKYRKK
jgi:hypothetical protein